jgi:cell wall-associated NlpC family hydrolase
LLLAATLALAGCASSGNNQYVDASLHAERDSYLSQTKSDPLGLYLAEGPRSSSSNGGRFDNVSRFDDASTKKLAATALNFLGIKYRYGGDTPKNGFDCSGLVMYAAEKSLGLKLPHRSAELAHTGLPVKRNDLKKGDLVFFNTRGHRNSHVGIYLGNDQFVHAPRTGSSVRIESMDIAYWKQRYNGARRLAANSSRLADAVELDEQQ